MSQIKKELESLTFAQKKLLPKIRDKWVSIGLSTEPMDKVRAEAAIKKVYLAGKIKWHNNIIWAESPLSAVLCDAIIRNSIKNSLRHSGRKTAPIKTFVRNSVRNSVWDSVWDSVGDSVGDSVWDSVRNSVRNSVGDSVGDSVRNSVWDSVGDSVGNSVGNSVRASVEDSVWVSVGNSVEDSVGNSVRASVENSVWVSVGDSVGASVGDSVRNSVRDSVRTSAKISVRGVINSFWESVYLSYYDTMSNIGLDHLTAPLNGLMELNQSAGFWIPRRGWTVIANRPSVIKLDDQSRIHNESGPAIAYRDGFEIYGWHGLRVNKNIIMEPITLDQIKNEANVEIRRVMITRYGEERYIIDSGAKSIQKDKFGELFRIDRNNDTDLVMVKVTNFTPEPDGTYKNYYLRVPPTIKTAHGAVAWTFNTRPMGYSPKKQT